GLRTTAVKSRNCGPPHERTLLEFFDRTRKNLGDRRQHTPWQRTFAPDDAAICRFAKSYQATVCLVLDPLHEANHTLAQFIPLPFKQIRHA
ncbi:MAG TPA: hypothetical protein VNU47_01670, partial [Candidatus Paceibacterota bacterium]|nr:hypothetical protein [Candidatus Paceibacterota bacterium]